MHAQSRSDWARFNPEAIPTKAHVPQLEQWLRALDRRNLPQLPMRMLDIGCGAGSVTRLLVARGFAVIGIDINAAAIAQLQHQQHGQAQFHERDVASSHGFALGAAQFDGAVCQLVASIVGDVDDRAQLLRNIVSVLRPGGALFISFSGRSEDINAEYAELYARDEQETGEHGSYLSRDSSGRVLYRTHHFTADEIQQLLQEHGFCEIQLEEQIEASSRRPEQRARFYYVSCQRG
jgi:SAM-dependent methyltransferase